MEKQKFVSEQESMRNQIRDLEQRLIYLQRDYISEHSKFTVGDTVMVKTPECYGFTHRKGVEEKVLCPEEIEYGFVERIKLDSNNDPYPVLIKMKKNGCPSKQRLYYSPTATLHVLS